MSDERKTRILSQEEKAREDDHKPTRLFNPDGPGARNDLPAHTAPMAGSSLEKKQVSEPPATRVVSALDAQADTPLTGVGEASADAQANEDGPVVGWLVVVDGPGKGRCRSIFNGLNNVGRAPEQRIPLDFGDTKISREGHMQVIFDDRNNDYFIKDNGKTNLVRMNGEPVLSNMPLISGATIELGETTLMFVALCNEQFSWTQVDAG